MSSPDGPKPTQGALQAEGALRAEGTRVAGVVRVRADSAAEGIARLSAELTEALHSARDYNRLDLLKNTSKPPAVQAKCFMPKNIRQLGLYDVMWQAEQGASGSSGQLLQLGGTLAGLGSHATSRPRSPCSGSPPLKGEPSSPRASSPRASSPRPLSPRPSSPRPSGAMSSPRTAQHGHAPAALASQYGQPRPAKTNPHSALLLDVHTRLLRTSGASFTYLSGRAQLDGGLPWIKVGRHDHECATDRRDITATLRPQSSRTKHSPHRATREPGLTWAERSLKPTLHRSHAAAEDAPAAEVHLLNDSREQQHSKSPSSPASYERLPKGDEVAALHVHSRSFDRLTA